MIQASTGNVGIGTTSPTGALHVSGEGIINERNGGPFIRFLDSSDASGNKTWILQSNAPTVGDFRIRNETDNVDALVVHANGSMNLTGDLTTANLGVNTTPFLNTRVSVQGNMAVSGKLVLTSGTPGAAFATNILEVEQNSATDPIADAWTTYSSKRWKKNIRTLDSALQTVARLRGVSYDWKADGKHDIGLIAEEVGEVLPEIVTYEENGIDAKSVAYARLVAVLIEAVKQQQTMISNLNERLNAFEMATK